MGPVLLVVAWVGGQVGTGVEVRTLAGESVTGSLHAVAADGSLTVGDKTVAGGEWYSIRRTGGGLPPWPRAPHAELTTGDRVVGVVSEADGDALRLRVSFPGEREQLLRLPVSSLRAIWVTARPADAPDPDWLTASRKRDLFLARNGDSVTGALTGIDSARNLLTYHADGKDRHLEWSKLSAIGFNTDLARVRRPKGPYYRLTLTDGTRLAAQAVAFDGRHWNLTTAFKDDLRIPARQVVSVEVEQGKVTFLSDLKPTTYQYHTFDGEQFNWAADRCVTGRALTLTTAAGESTFDRGVGLHAECVVTYGLGGKYRRFETLVGLDATFGVRGSAVLVVQMDGKEQSLPDNGRLTGATGPLDLKIDVTGAKELTIVVRRGPGGNVQDHVNLAEARLVP